MITSEEGVLQIRAVTTTGRTPGELKDSMANNLEPIGFYTYNTKAAHADAIAATGALTDLSSG